MSNGFMSNQDNWSEESGHRALRLVVFSACICSGVTWLSFVDPGPKTTGKVSLGCIIG